MIALAAANDADTVAYIPARLGSERVPRKNLRLLGGSPLISYASKAALRARSLDRVYVNTESIEIAAAAATTGVEIYPRAPHLATSTVTTDEILYDFARSVPASIIAVINPTAPFLKPETIDQVVAAYHGAPANATLFTTTLLRKHLVVGGTPQNFDPTARSPRTQDLKPFEYINFIMFIVPRAKVIGEYERRGSCLYGPPLAFFPMSGHECHDIDDQHDFEVAEALLAISVGDRQGRSDRTSHGYHSASPLS